VTIPTASDVAAVHEATPGRYRIAVTLAAHAGLRAGEVTGLTRDRVDFLRRQLQIDRQLVSPVAATPRFGPPKSAQSIRTVPLADHVLDEISKHIADYEIHDGGLLVVSDLEAPMARAAFGRMWRQVQADAGVHVRFHDLRHYCASVLLSAGVPIPQVAAMLGHTPAVLLKTYAHVIPGDDDRARAAISKAFSDADFSRTDPATGST
jgi:integrase